MVATLGVKQSESVPENDYSLPELADAVRADEAASEAESAQLDSHGRERVDWSALVRRIQDGDDSAMGELYESFARGIRFYLCRQLGPQELDDKVHDTFLIVVQAIRRGELREPERLMGFVRTVVRRQVAAHIDHVVHSRREELHIDMGVRVADSRRNPEQSAVLQQKIEFMRSILDELAERDCEILTRFYLLEESQQQICNEMQLTETQFRLLKSRAKARFGELGKRRLQQKPMLQFLSRTSAQLAH
ncbi:MAG TPA: sigma-70 family RNA polymerase sigma factor [Bryobacteraceae bacterium]|nr:sigma-70 family RNA polymerase sigma factor [Bryobacteraceae bacterium]